MQITLRERNNPTFKEYYNKLLIFTENYFKEIDQLLQIAQNVYMPIEIAEALNKLQINVLIEPIDKSKYFVVDTGGFTKQKRSVGLLNGKEISFKEFIDQWNDLISYLKIWVKQNVKNSSLNINI